MGLGDGHCVGSQNADTGKMEDFKVCTSVRAGGSVKEGIEVWQGLRRGSAAEWVRKVGKAGHAKEGVFSSEYLLSALHAPGTLSFLLRCINLSNNPLG